MQKNKRIVPLTAAPLALVLLLLTGCLKNSLQAPPAPGVNADTTHNIKAVLAASSLHIFYAALEKAGLDTVLHPTDPFTIFAPTDSAFTAAGITLQSLNSLSADSLSRLIRYHIVRGVFTDANLQVSPGNISAPSLLTKLAYDSAAGYSAYQYYLYLDKKTTLMVNGNPVNTGAASLSASNGNIYSLDTILIAPTQTVWQLIRRLPELSAYYQACQIDDSINLSFGWGPESSDSALFSKVVYNGTRQPAPLTLLAPVNAAFANSPYPTPDDLINYGSQYDPNYYNSLLTAIIRGQIAANPKESMNGNSGYELFYNDFLEISNINNGIYNMTGTYPAYDVNYNLVFFYLQFLRTGNTVGINWGDGFLHGPAHILPARNILAINGVIHEVDNLFLFP